MTNELQCFFHDECPVGPDTYLICFECQHAFTAEELLTLANEELHRIYAMGTLENQGVRLWNKGKYVGPDLKTIEVVFIPYVDPEDVNVCPLCTHDF